MPVRKPVSTGTGGWRPENGKLDNKQGSRPESFKSQGEAENKLVWNWVYREKRRTSQVHDKSKEK